MKEKEGFLEEVQKLMPEYYTVKGYTPSAKCISIIFNKENASSDYTDECKELEGIYLGKTFENNDLESGYEEVLRVIEVKKESFFEWDGASHDMRNPSDIGIYLELKSSNYETIYK